MRSTLVILALAACGDGTSEPVRGRVDVVAYTDLTAVPQPDHGALVVFADRDGTSRTAFIDEQGQATGEVEAGGSVWVGRFVADQIGFNVFTAYTDVQAGAMLEFGPPAQPARTGRGTMTVVATPPDPCAFVTLRSRCARTDAAMQLTFDNRCGATADVLVTAFTVSAGGGTCNRTDALVSYAYLPAQSIVDGGMIVVGAGDWRVPETITVNLRNATVSSYVDLKNDFGAGQRLSFDGGVLTAAVPLVGTALHLETSVGTLTSLAQQLKLKLPVTMSHDVDLATVVAPWVVREQNQPLVWRTNSSGGLVAHAMLIQHSWTQPIANYEEQNRVRIIAAPQADGTVEIPQLPDALIEYQPGADFRVDASVRLMRIEGAPTVDPLRAIEQATRNPGGSTRLEDLPGTSIAITEQN